MGGGDTADYGRETGRGHDITYDEAMEILKRAEDNGFVHQVTNIDGENKIFAICNCNVKICNALRTSQLFNTPNMSASAYRAHVNKENCVACGQCVEYCPAGALKLGQKLCRKMAPQLSILVSLSLISASGEKRCGTKTIATTIESTATLQVRLLVRQRALPTLQSRDT